MKVKINKSINIHLQNGKDALMFKEILRCARRNLDDGHCSLHMASILDEIKAMAQSLLDEVDREV